MLWTDCGRRREPRRLRGCRSGSVLEAAAADAEGSSLTSPRAPPRSEGVRPPAFSSVIVGCRSMIGLIGKDEEQSPPRPRHRTSERDAPPAISRAVSMPTARPTVAPRLLQRIRCSTMKAPRRQPAPQPLVLGLRCTCTHRAAASAGARRPCCRSACRWPSTIMTGPLAPRIDVRLPAPPPARQQCARHERVEHPLVRTFPMINRTRAAAWRSRTPPASSSPETPTRWTPRPC